MKEKIGIIGSGYVGLVTGACFVHFGHEVVFNDIDELMLEKLNKGQLPIHEQGLQDLVDFGLKNKLIDVTTDKKQLVSECNILILALPTPPKADGNADLQIIRQACKEIGQSMAGPKIIINKSTAPVGSSHLIREIIRHYYPGDFDVVSMPEFLQEGKAIESSLNADRYVIGFETKTSQKVRNQVLDLIKPFNSPIVETDNRTAELAKYICNAFLPLEISFINSMTAVCEKLGVDIIEISKIMRLDKRIGTKAFLDAGPGYGGMCFPKDVWSIIGIADRFGYTHKLLKVVDEINVRQQISVAEKIEKFVKGVDKPRITILGLSFKKNTSDVRFSQSKVVIEKLIEKGFSDITVFDPIAINNFRQFNLPINYAHSINAAAQDSDCLVIMTDWDQFKELNLIEIYNKMKSKNLIDARNLIDKEMAKKLGFRYVGMGRI